MQPAEPMGVSGDDLQDNKIPEHLPIQMALAPEQHPYDHQHVIRSQDVDDDESEESKHRRKLASHSLSPEQLGVTGYVKDVAGFVKDAVQGVRDKKAAQRISGQQQHQEQHTASHEEHQQPSTRKVPAAPAAVAASPPARSSSPLAEAVTGLFPGLDPNAHGCTHADELRHDLMQQHTREDMADPSHRMLHEQ